MNSLKLIILLLIAGNSFALCQNFDKSNFQKTVEYSKRVLNSSKGTLIGYYENFPLLRRVEDPFNNKYFFNLLSEEEVAYQVFEKKFHFPNEKSDWKSGFIKLLKFNNSLWLYSMGYMSDDYEIYYQNLWLQSRNQNYLLDSIYNSDKIIHSSFSSDGKYLLVNTLNTLSDHYNPEQDDRIMVYDLEEINKGKVKKEYIPCEHCSDSYLIGDKLFFMKANERDAYNGFDNTEIYIAPWGKLQDSVKIASTSKIVAISPDGKYILATRFFDTQKTTCVIIDVEKKKYQLLLGRDYAKAKAFYSFHEEKFAFDFGGWIAYIDLPKDFPFNALNWRNSEIPDATEHTFWEQYQHAPFEKK